MTAIKKLLLENFQSHEHTEIEFTTGLNVIVGPSDQGKSAIIRALRWVLFNEPRGSDFIRSGSTSCQVSIELTNGTRITRMRGIGKNRYTINQADGTEQVFEGFGSGVPKEVTDAHGMPQIYLDTDMTEPLNFSYQLDGPFLLSESGATKAKAIGRLIGVHVIDAALRLLLKDLTNQQQEERRLEEAYEDLGGRLREYDDLETMGTLLAKGEALQLTLQEKINRHLRLLSLQEKWLAGETEYRKTRALLTKLSGLNQVDTLLRQAFLSWQNTVRLTTAQARLITLAQEQQKTSVIIEQTKNTMQVEAIYHCSVSRSLLQNRLSQTWESLRSNQIQGAALQQVLAATVSTSIVENSHLCQISSRMHRVSALESTAARYAANQRELTAQTAECQCLNGVTAAAASTVVVSEKSVRLLKLISLQTAWQENHRSFITGQDYLEKLSLQTEGLITAYQSKLTELGRCPFCYNSIDASSIAHIMEQLTREVKTANVQ